MKRRAPFLTTAALLLTACGDTSSAGDGFTVLDSAGVRVATSAAPFWTEATRWRVAEAPDLELGRGQPGDSAVLFAAVEGVHVLSSGTLAVYDPWAPGIFFFDPAGQFVGRVGRTGSGPGEFPARSTYGPESFSCGADTVYARVLRQFAAFMPPDRHVRTFTPAELFRIRGCVGERYLGTTSANAWPTTPGLHVDSVVLAWYDGLGHLLSVIDSLPSSENVYSAGGHEGLGYSPRLFGRRLGVAVGQDVVATSFGSAITLVRGAPGEVRRTLIRVAGEGRTVGEEDVRRFRDFVMNPWRGNADELRRMETRLDEAEGREYPLFAELRFDPDGNLWARLYDHLDAVAFFDYSRLSPSMQAPEFGKERHWMVFREDGRYLGQVAMPADFTVRHIGAAHVLGVWKDAYDVPHVRRYRIEK